MSAPLVERFDGGRRLSSALSWPVTNPHTGETWYLSTGQRALLFWIRAQMAYGRHTFTLDQASRAVGIDRSNVARGLDRFAAWGLLRRRSTPGRAGGTRVYPSKRAAALRGFRVGDPARGIAPRIAWASRRGPLGRNVATTTPRGGFLSREELERSGWRSGNHPPTPSAEGGGGERTRRYGPPRQLYVRCHCRTRVRLQRWHQRSAGGLLEGRWVGRCRRCGRPSELTLRAIVSHGGWTRAGEAASRTDAARRIAAWEASRALSRPEAAEDSSE